MVAFVRKLSRLLMLLPLLASVISCSSTTSDSAIGSPFVMSISPSPTTVAVGMEIPVVVSITGSDQTNVSWKVNDALVTDLSAPFTTPYGVVSPTSSPLSILFRPTASPGSTITITATSITFPNRLVSTTITVAATPVYSRFSTAGTMLTPRYSHTANFLSSGNVLVTGGFGPSVSGGIFSSYTTLNSAELCSPTIAFTATGSMSTKRAFHTATVLYNGNVLVTGGVSSRGPAATPLASAEIYNYHTGVFSPTTMPMFTARELHAATLLKNGDVLITGGKNGTNALNSAELYTVATGVFHNLTSSMIVGRFSHTATRLSDGTVLIAGGTTNTGATATAEIYDPTTRTFSSPTGLSLSTARTGHTATSLNNFDVLITGGGNATADIYTTSFASVSGMTNVRTNHAAAHLPNDTILVIGGSDGTNSLTTTDIFSLPGTFSTSFVMKYPRFNHTATTLYNGNVVVIGGFNTYSSNAPAVGKVEIYK